MREGKSKGPRRGAAMKNLPCFIEKESYLSMKISVAGDNTDIKFLFTTDVSLCEPPVMDRLALLVTFSI